MSSVTSKQLSEIQQFQSQPLTNTERSVKWSLKVLVMSVGVAVGTILGKTLSPLLPLALLGTAIGSGVAFIATMKGLQIVDEHFQMRAMNRYLLELQEKEKKGAK